MKSIKFLAASAVLVMLTMTSCQNKPEVGTDQPVMVSDSVTVDSLTYDSVVISHKSDTILIDETK